MRQRLIVKYRENGDLNYVNISADSITEREGFIFAYLDGHLVGAFDLGLIETAYMSGGQR